jgi:selenocysteine lyase/cysteine desulfurase
MVLVGPYEHHSNELPWCESHADVAEIALTVDGCLDLGDLAQKLRACRARPLVIGSFSAASNVTGLLTDVDAVGALLHAEGALAFWDYAAAGPYADIRVEESSPGAGDGKDAVFLSPHKFMGGPQTPGVLVVRRDLIGAVPSTPGGGTVEYVDPTDHVYLPDAVQREGRHTRHRRVHPGRSGVPVEGGRRSPAHPAERGDAAAARDPALAALRRHRDSGRPRGRSAAIFSFTIRHRGQWLHHQFVAAVLNDVFGIQARSGCSCAGPYGHHLLGIDPARSIGSDRSETSAPSLTARHLPWQSL